MTDKKYILTVQCRIAKERCSGYMCEHTFHEKGGAFDRYSKDQGVRFLSIDCGGCSGRALQRTLADFLRKAKKRESMKKEDIGVHLASCVAFDSYHAPPCPHKEYLADIIVDKCGLDLTEGSVISVVTEKRRQEGIYAAR